MLFALPAFKDGRRVERHKIVIDHDLTVDPNVVLNGPVAAAHGQRIVFEVVNRTGRDARLTWDQGSGGFRFSKVGHCLGATWMAAGDVLQLAATFDGGQNHWAVQGDDPEADLLGRWAEQMRNMTCLIPLKKPRVPPRGCPRCGQASVDPRTSLAWWKFGWTR